MDDGHAAPENTKAGDCAEFQRVAVLLLSCSMLGFFAPKGFFVGILVLFGTHIYVMLQDYQDNSKKLGREGTSLQVEAENEKDADGREFGPSLVLVFDSDVLDTVKEEQTQDHSSSGPSAPPSPRRSSRTSELTMNDMLQRLLDCGLEYRLGSSPSGHFTYCVCRVPEDTARNSLLVYGRDMQLDPEMAYKYAKTHDMLLARRCRGPDDDDDETPAATATSPPVISATATRETIDTEILAAKQAGLPFHLWWHLHIRYTTSVPVEVFRHFALVPRIRSTQPSAAPKAVSKTWNRRGTTDSLSPSHEYWARVATGAAGSMLEGRGKTLLSPAARLRLLLQIAGDDARGAFGGRGAGLMLDQWKTPRLKNFLAQTCRNLTGKSATPWLQRMGAEAPPGNFLWSFLLQEPRDGVFDDLRERYAHPGSKQFRERLLSAIWDSEVPPLLRHYFGQQIAFYFAFVQHLYLWTLRLTAFLSPLLACYMVAWTQLVLGALKDVSSEEGVNQASEAFFNGLASQISATFSSSSKWEIWAMVIGLTTVIWGQCALESWRVKEQMLSVRWGCSRVGVRKRPRPGFGGKVALSPVTGHFELVHQSDAWFKCRLVLSNGIFFCLTIMFLFVTIFISGLGLESRFAARRDVKSRGNFWLGMIYSMVTAIIYATLKAVAVLLTKMENHKSEEAWEASVLVKKWMITVVMQTSAIGYLLFARPLFYPCAYGEDEVKRRMGVFDCDDRDGPCCNDAVWRKAGEVYLTFAEVRNTAALLETRQFIVGWLTSKIFIFPLCKWLVPRVTGFVCTRGLYPCLAFDFATDLMQEMLPTGHSTPRLRAPRTRCWSRVRQMIFRLRCCRCCPRRLQQKLMAARRTTTFRRVDLKGLYGGGDDEGLPPEMIDACEGQLDKYDPWDVLETANDLSVHFLVTLLTTVVYPFAPLVFLGHLLIEFQTDLHCLFSRRQPKPQDAAGLPPAWTLIFQSYVYTGAACNFAIITFRTPLMKQWFGRDDPAVNLAFFSTANLLLILVTLLVRVGAGPVPYAVAEHLQRQEEVEAFFARISKSQSSGLRGVMSGTGLDAFSRHSPRAETVPAQKCVSS